jgi:hypothetical protein
MLNCLFGCIRLGNVARIISFTPARSRSAKWKSTLSKKSAMLVQVEDVLQQLRSKWLKVQPNRKNMVRFIAGLLPG